MSDLWAITTYFNPCRYKTRRVNYERFMEGLARQGVPCFTVECVFDGEEFELPPGPNLLQIRSESLLWQKERLLNLAAQKLPREARYVAWLDADILFENDRWPLQAKHLMDTHPVVQLFTSADRLDEQGNRVGDVVYSFGAVTAGDPELLEAQRYDVHGHTGYAWAMTRELFDKVGLYEHSVVGSSDHFMAHAIYNDYGFCIANALKHDTLQIEHFKAWGQKFHAIVQGRFAVVPGRINHLWHGDLKNRRYFMRMHDVTDLGFNPNTDVEAPEGRPLRWTTTARAKPELIAYFYNYFAARQEDGEQLERAA